MIDADKLNKLQRYARLLALLALVVFLLLIVVSLWSLWRVRNEISSLEQRRAELTAQAEQARQELQKLEERRQALEAQRDLLTKTIAEIATRNPEPVKQAFNEATTAQLEAPKTTAEKKRRESTEQAIAQVIQAEPRVARSLKRIYLHIGNEKQQERARQIAEQLRKAGYLVPGIENVGEHAPQGLTELRCSLRNEAERAEAMQIISLLQQAGVNMQPQPIRIDTRPWQYEIWFGTTGLKAGRAD